MTTNVDPGVKRWRPENGDSPLVQKKMGDSPLDSPHFPVREIGGRKDGTDPTRYGDWEKNGRCIDF